MNYKYVQYKKMLMRDWRERSYSWSACFTR